MDTLAELNDVFREVFENDDLSVTRSTSAQDVPAWDSLMYVNLLIAVESKFGLRFVSSEVASVKSVGELVELVDKHCGR